MPACALQLGWPQTSDEQSGAMRCRAWLPLLGTQWPLWPKVCAASQLPELHKAGFETMHESLIFFVAANVGH